MQYYGLFALEVTFVFYYLQYRIIVLSASTFRGHEKYFGLLAAAWVGLCPVLNGTYCR